MNPPPAGPENRRPDSHAELPTDPDAAPDTDGAAPPMAGAPTRRPLHLQPTALLWVFGGGIIGTGLRYWVEKLLPHDPAHWPWGTFLVNLAGAFLLGALLEGLARAGEDAGWRRRARLFAGTGGCGAFTTYSTLSLEVSISATHHQLVTAVSYGVTSVVIGTLMAWLGIVTAAEVHRRRAAA